MTHIGVPLNYLKSQTIDPEEFAAYMTAIKTLEKLGAVIDQDILFSSQKEQQTLELCKRFGSFEEYFGGDWSADLLLDLEFAEGLADYLTKLDYNPSGVKNLRELVKFTVNCPGEEFPYRNIVGRILVFCEINAHE